MPGAHGSVTMRWIDRVTLGLLILDGFAIGLGSIAFCYLRFWGQPIPVVAVIAGLLNAAVMWLAARTTDAPPRFAPLVAWFLMIAVGFFGGPGGDVVLYPANPTLAATLMLLVFGAGIPMALAWSGKLPQPDSR